MAQGIDVRQTTGRLQFRVYLTDENGDIVTTGTTSLRLYELQDGGTVFSYDWNDNTFKSTALTTPTQAMTHRQGDNNTYDTGVWTVDEVDVGDFVVGGIYLMQVENTNAMPPRQTREFQFGNAEGDMTVTAARLDANVEAINADATAADNLATGLAVAPGSAGGLPLTTVDNLVEADAVAISGESDTADRLELSLTAALGGIDVNLEQALDTSPTADTSGDALFNAARALPNGDLPGSTNGIARVADLLAGAAGVTLRLVSSVMQASSTTTALIANASDLPSGDADADYANLLVIARDVSAGSRVNVRFVTTYVAATNTFNLSSALGFTPEVGVDTFEIWGHTTADSTVTTELTKLTTGFSAANPNNLNSYLKSMMSKVATVPSGVGTYDPATDSLEVLRERLDLITGVGFSTSTDSLTAIRDAIDDLLAPIVAASSSSAGVGFLSECVSLIRKATDEPSVTPKYTNGDLIEYIHSAFDQVLSSINIDTDHPILVRHDVSVVNGTQDYVLPCSVGEIWRVAKIDETTRVPVWELWPSNEFTLAGYGFTVEGNILRFLTSQITTQTLQILYMPNSEVAIHTGTAEDGSTTTIEFDPVPTEGTLDIRPNGYAGYMVRLLQGVGAGQERVVESYDSDTLIATVRPAWTTAPDDTTVYEVLPQYSRLIKHVVVGYASLDVLGNEAKSARRAEIEKQVQRKMTALRNTLGKKVNRFGTRGPGVDTIDNQDLWPFVP